MFWKPITLTFNYSIVHEWKEKGARRVTPGNAYYTYYDNHNYKSTNDFLFDYYYNTSITYTRKYIFTCTTVRWRDQPILHLLIVHYRCWNMVFRYLRVQLYDLLLTLPKSRIWNASNVQLDKCKLERNNSVVGTNLSVLRINKNLAFTLLCMSKMFWKMNSLNCKDLIYFSYWSYSELLSEH